MKITIVGSGYVGLVAGACFAEMGNDVYCIDKNARRVADLEAGIIPIYEPGLEDFVVRNHREGRLHFSTVLNDGLKSAEIVFIAVGTPPNEDGSADLQHVIAVAKEIGENLNEYKIIVDKSTVPVGTADRVRETIVAELRKRNVRIEFDVVSNPEFLKEGDAVNDFMKPDRVIIGADSKRAKETMEELYRVFFRKSPRCISMDVRSAEVTKYAANSMLATKISFMNEISNLCEKVGADVEMVRVGIGADARIGYSFIYPGIGYGGSCFPKDVKAIIKTAKDYGYEMEVLQAVESVNRKQKHLLAKKIKNYFDLHNEKLDDKTIAVWGLSFKPETDDMREAPSIEIIRDLVSEGATIKVHDPKAFPEAKRNFGDILDKIVFCENNYEAVEGADALAVLTEWHMYRQPDFERIKREMKKGVIFDGRNMYTPEYVKGLGLEYFGIGRRMKK